MKNIQSFVSPAEVVNFSRSLFQTPEFKHSGVILDMIEQFAYLPRVFAEASDDRLERAHFSTWWNTILLREYDNPYVNDLYYAHEMHHAATMPYIKDIGFAPWNEKMQRNELDASVFSEFQVYFEIENLRENSFAHPIFADRYLKDERFRSLWQANPMVAMETIRTERRNIMFGKPHHLLDDDERWIRMFADQNSVYANVWVNNFRVVENHMAKFLDQSLVDREMAMENHLQFLDHHSTDGIPFYEEASLFTPFYWANKKRYDDAMKK